MTQPGVAIVVRNPATHDARVLRTAAALRDAGATVTIVAAAADGVPDDETREGIRFARVEPASRLLSLLDAIANAPSPGKAGVLARRLLRPARRAVRAWGFQTAAARAMAEARPDAYHCNDIHTVWTGLLAARRHRAPVVYDAHEIYAHQHLVPRTLRRRLLVGIAEWVVLHRCAAAITVNDSIAAWYARTYHVAAPSVVRNVPSAPAARAATTGLPEMPPQPALLYVGGLTSGRGIVPSVQALRHLPGVQLALLGGIVAPKEMTRITAAIETAGVAERVHLLGRVAPEDVTAVAARARIGLVLIEDVCLSYRLSLPNKLFEYAHAGIPVVASDFPEIRAVVGTYGSGVLCDPSDPAAIAAAVRSLLEDDALHARCVAGARAVAERFRWENEARTLLQVYRGVVPSLAAAA